MGRRERHYEPGANLEEEEERTRAEAIPTLVGAASGRRPEESPPSGVSEAGEIAGEAQVEDSEAVKDSLAPHAPPRETRGPRQRRGT